jgi:hypothetical protein
MAVKDIIRAPRPKSAPPGNTLAVLDDPDWRARFFAEIGNGTPPYLAAELTGISRNTMYRWMFLGGARNPQGVPDDAPEPYRTFVIQLKIAEATMKRPVVSNMYEVAKKDAHFGLKYMQAREPEEWMPNRNLNYTALDDADEDEPSTRLVIQMSKDEYRAFLQEKQQQRQQEQEPATEPPRPAATADE